ncbi:MAG: lipocalin family protein, partial [Pseudomonadota bacterium]
SAWLDREWSSQLLDDDQAGWDWIALSFENGARLMGFRIRGAQGADATRGSWISADGVVTNLAPGALTMTPIETTQTPGGPVPTTWQIRLDEQSIDVTASAVNPQSWMDTTVAYWEGPMRVTGSHEGRGYLEMTGYE